MALGLGKGFVFSILIGLFFAIGMKTYEPFLWIVGTFIALKIIWSLLTK